MNSRRIFYAAFAVFACRGSMASAQTDPPSAPVPADTPRMIDPYLYRPTRRPPTYSRTTPNPESRPALTESDAEPGFRNPGGVGRFAEYYPAGNQFQNQNQPMRAAGFGNGGLPTVQEQMQAQQLGVAKTNALNSQIEAYSRPGFGYGYGYGFGLGFGVPFPY